MTPSTPPPTDLGNVTAYYAGIGSRKITVTEQDLIMRLSAELALNGLVGYSGNADGSDIAFQIGARGRCVLMLPSLGWNTHHYNVEHAIANFVVGDKAQGQQAVFTYHPNPKALTPVARLFLARNYYQVMGTANFPKVRFVVAVADVDALGHEVGGTGHTCRIARAMGVPIFNLRSLGLDKTWDAISHLLKATGSPLPSEAKAPAPTPPAPAEWPKRREIPGMPTGQRAAIEQALRSALAWGLTYGVIIPPKQQSDMIDTQVAQHMAAIEKWGKLS